MLSELYDIEREALDECMVCEGMGFLEMYLDEYDIEDVPCEACAGTGFLE